MKPSGIPSAHDERDRAHFTVEITSFPRVTRRTYFAILLALPALLFVLNRNWTFQGFGDYDSFFYFGNFIHFPHYQRLLPTYFGERLPWILPGYALVHLFNPVYGTLALHWLAFYTSIFSLYSIVTRFSGSQAGFLAACALGIHPYFLAANGIDYVMGGCQAYCLLTFALLVRSVFSAAAHRWVYLFLAGLSWAAVVFTHPFWVLFSPACLAVYRAAEESCVCATVGWRARLCSTIRSGLVFTMGGVALTFGLMAMHKTIYGNGGLAFLTKSIEMARITSHMKVSPWASETFSVTYADWLVFPGLAAALSLVLAVPHFRRWLGSRAGTSSLLWMYLYFFSVMVVMTVLPGRILQFDYFATFLLPGAFIVFGITIFDLPMQLSRPWFWGVIAIACGISLAPLAKPGLYVKPPVLGAIVPGLFLSGSLAVHLLRPRLVAALIFSALGWSAASFCLAPAVGGIAWSRPGDWMEATRRVGSVVQTIEGRLPRDKYPAFWYSQLSPNGLEFQAIMCAFLSHGLSMLNLPEVDPGRRYKPGQVLILLTDRPVAIESTAAIMRGYGMPLSLLWQQQITSSGVAYWLTATEVRQP